MKFSILLFLTMTLCLSCRGQKKTIDPSIEHWITLFNGKDLNNWQVKITGYELNDNIGSTFRIVDSLLTVSYESYDSFENRFGHIFYQDSFSYYRVRTTYRFINDQVAGGPGWAYRNSGIMLHGQSPETMTKEQDFPISIEAQLLGGNGNDPRTTMNLCTPGTHVVMGDSLFTTHCVNSTSQTFHGDQWVEAGALVLGDSMIIHYINGEEVLRYYQPQVGGGVVGGHDPKYKSDGELIKGGFISLQSESHPVQFKQVELLNLCGCLDRKAINYRSYYVKHNQSTCLY